MGCLALPSPDGGCGGAADRTGNSWLRGRTVVVVLHQLLGGTIERRYGTAQIDAAAWPLPAVFGWLSRSGNVASAEMGRTFNNGVGMVVAVGAGEAQAVAANLSAAGETVYVIGKLVEGSGSGEATCTLRNAESWGA